MASEMQESDVDQNQIHDLEMYFGGINKRSGVIALSANPPGISIHPERLDRAQSLFSAVVPEYKFTALYTDDSSLEDAIKQAKLGSMENLRDLSLVMTPFSSDKRLMSAVDDKILAIETTHDGFTHTYQDDVRMLSLETALGMYTQTIDFSRVYYPTADEDDWSRLGNFWSSGITHLNHFKAFDRTDVYELEDRVRGYLNMNYGVTFSQGSIDVEVENKQSSSWFILRTHHLNEIDVVNGNASKIEDNAWLIHTDTTGLSVIVEKTDTLGL